MGHEIEMDFDNDGTEEFSTGAARALWASSWADGEEERGNSIQGQILDQMPPVPISAWVAAGELIGLLESSNKANIFMLMERAKKADGVKSIDIEEFGFSMAMQALGTGVSWFDNHANFKLEDVHMEYHAGSQFG